jgi:acyl-CoA dehydrogenase
MSDELFTLPRRYIELQAEARALADSVVAYSDRADEADHIDPDMRRLLAASGLASVLVPSEFGGRFDAVDSLAATVVREVLAGESAHLDSLFAMQGIGSFALAIGASAEVRNRWLPAIGVLDAIAALCLTEPDVGSDLRSISTTAVEDGRDLVVTGHKSFITNAGDADVYTVLVRHGEGYSLVCIPADTSGVSVSHPHQIIAPHVLGDVIFDGVRVPRDHLVGAPGRGFSLMLATLATFRVSVAGSAVGMAQRALDEALLYTAGREQFGVPVARLGPVPSMLSMSWVDIEQARALTYQAAAAAARDPLSSLNQSSMAKVAATEAAGRVLDRAVQVTGRFGLTRGTVIERLYRGVRPMRIYEGSTEVILDSLSKQLLKGVAASR